MKKVLSKNKIIISLLLGFAIIHIVYLAISIHSVPLMDYWRCLQEIGDKTFSNSLGVNDFWQMPSGFHRNPMLYFIFMLNIKYFNWNINLEIFLSSFAMLGTSIILFISYKKSFANYDAKSNIVQVLFIAVLLAVYNMNQWEIIQQEFSLSFMIRIFVFCAIFINLDKILQNIIQYYKKLLPLSIAIVLATLLLSQGYFLAMNITVLFILLLHVIVNYKKAFKYNLYYLLFVALIIIGIIIYMIGVEGSTSKDGISVYFESLINGNFIKGVLVMLGASIVHVTLQNMISSNQLYMFIGLLLLIVYIISIIIYIRNKYYKRTHVPLALIVYALLSIVIIFIGRANAFSIDYLMASRYICETTLGLVGLLWIMILYVVEKTSIQFKRKITSSIPTIFVSIMLLLTMYFEFQVAPYRKQYGESLIPIMESVDNASDQDLIPFQAHSPDLVRNGVEFMKAHKLGVFNDSSIGSILKPEQFISGYFSDHWIGQTAEFKIRSGEKGQVIISGYYPKQITGSETGIVYINGIENQFVVLGENINLVYNVQPNSVIIVKIQNNFSFQATPPDTRALSFVLTNVQGK